MRRRRLRALPHPAEERGAAIRAQWQETARSTMPVDRAAMEDAVGRLYRLAELAPPRFVWADSPGEAMLAAYRLSGGPRVPFADPHWTARQEALERPGADVAGPTVRWRLRRYRFSATTGGWPGRPGGEDRLLRRWHAQRTTAGLMHSWWNRAGMRVWDSVDASVRRSVAGVLHPTMLPWDADPQVVGFRHPLRNTVTEALFIWSHHLPRDHGREYAAWLRVYDVSSVSDRLSSDVLALPYLREPHDLDWVAEYEGLRRLGVVRYRADAAARLDAFVAVAGQMDWWWPFTHVCVCAERPARVRTEPDPGRGPGAVRAHAPDGPAVTYRDGWTAHAWHGVPVPERVITGDVTARDWLRESNAEVRRVIAERMGYEWLLEQCRAERIATDAFGTLWRLRQAGNEEAIVLLDVRNSTPEPDGTHKRYVLRVPGSLTVPRDAIGWTFGLPPGTYDPAAMS